MGSNYICGQFEDAFEARRLCNWSGPIRTPSNSCIRQPTRNLVRTKFYNYNDNCKDKENEECRRNSADNITPSYLTGICRIEPLKPIRLTQFIANDRGHLLRPRRRKDESSKCQEEAAVEYLSQGWICGDEFKKYNRTKIPAWKVVPTYYKKESCNDDKSMDVVDKLMRQLKNKKHQLPIIWIFGQPQFSTVGVRVQYVKKLAKRLNFTYLDMDSELANWRSPHHLTNKLNYSTFDPDSDGKNINRRLFNQLKLTKSYLSIIGKRAHSMSARLHFNTHETLNSAGIIELLKYAMIQNYPTNGYIIMNFPTNVQEAEAFESAFWPITTGLYFEDFIWSHEKVRPIPNSEYLTPTQFRRTELYSEADVECCCDRFGYKTIKVLNAESIGDVEFQRIDHLIDQFLQAQCKIVNGAKIGLIPQVEESFLHCNSSHPIIIEGAYLKPPARRSTVGVNVSVSIPRSRHGSQNFDDDDDGDEIATTTEVTADAATEEVKSIETDKDKSKPSLF